MNNLFKLKGNSLKVFMALSVFSALFIFTTSGVRYNLFVLSIFFLIAILSLYGILISIDSKSYSLNKSFCLFYFFFFSLAPVVQFKNKTVFLIQEVLTVEVYKKTGAILLIILVLYLVFYHFLFKYLKNKNYLNSLFKINFESSFKNQIVISCFFVLFSLLAVLYLIKWDLSLLIFRPFAFSLKNNTNFGFVGYSLLLIFRLIPFIILLKYKIENKRNDKYTYFFLLMVILICFPSSLSRGMLAIVYIPILLLFIPVIKKGLNYVLLFMVGILLFFPLFNNFRHLKEGVLNFNFDLFNSGHFDAFQNMALLIDEQIITYGRQFLGSIFFFIQDSQWPNKPNGSGHLLGETVGYSYLNVSMPFFGEGYINWGYVGILVFLIIIVFFNAILDFVAKRGFNNVPLKSFYFIFLGFEFYLMRGDLYSSIKIISSFILALAIVWLFFLVNGRITKRFTSHKFNV